MSDFVIPPPIEKKPAVDPAVVDFEINTKTCSKLTTFQLRQELTKRKALDIPDDEINYKSMLRRLLQVLVKEEEQLAAEKEEKRLLEYKEKIEAVKKIKEARKQEAIERSKARQSSNPEYFSNKMKMNEEVKLDREMKKASISESVEENVTIVSETSKQSNESENPFAIGKRFKVAVK